MADKKFLRSNSVSSNDNLPKNDFNAAFSKLEKKIDNLTANLDKTIEAAVGKVIGNLASATSAVVERVSYVEKKVDTIDHSIRAKEIMISGIPYSNNENVLDLFGKISMHIGYKYEIIYSVDKIRRLAARATNSKNSVSCPFIVVCFSTLLLKNEFMKLYFAAKNLNISILGFSNSNRIYINHSLAKSTLELFLMAKKLKKSGVINSFFVRSAFVYILRNGENKPVKVLAAKDFPAVTPLEN